MPCMFPELKEHAIVQAESSGAEEAAPEQMPVLAASGEQIAAAKAADAAVDSLKENSTYNPRRMRPKRCARVPCCMPCMPTRIDTHYPSLWV